MKKKSMPCGKSENIKYDVKGRLLFLLKQIQCTETCEHLEFLILPVYMSLRCRDKSLNNLTLRSRVYEEHSFHMHAECYNTVTVLSSF